VSQNAEMGHYSPDPLALKLDLGFLEQFGLFSATRHERAC